MRNGLKQLAWVITLWDIGSVSHSLKKGQGAGQKKGTFDVWNSPKRALLLEQTFQMWARSVKRLE